MSASKLSDLLPIRASDIDPNAYRVFGLNAGERDFAKVQAAMQEVYARLKDAKPTAEPEIWKQALKMAEAARKLLSDPERRCALDASLEASGLIDLPAPSVGPGDSDPLAGLLPSTNPVASTAPGSPVTSTASAVLGMSPMGTPPAASAVLGTPPLGTTTNPNPAPTIDQLPSPGQAPIVQPAAKNESGAINWAPPKTKKKRRKKNGGMFLFGVFVLLMLGAIVGLLQFLSGGGRIALNKPGADAEDGVVVSQPMVGEPQRETPSRTARPEPSDGILETAPSSGVARPLRDPISGSGLGGVDPLRGMTSPENPSATMKSPEPITPEPTTQEPAMPQSPPTPPPNKPPTQPTPTQPTPAMLQANQAKIESVKQLIRSANWKEMKPEAVALLKRKLTSEQSKLASSLYDIADLSAYYRGGIERGLATLQTGATFEYVDDFPVIVVEATADSLSIQYNKKTQTYSLDDIPERLTETIAAFALDPDRPDSIAGLALYRLIHPKTNDEYRQDAFELLASVDGRLEKVDSAMLQKVAKEILAK